MKAVRQVSRERLGFGRKRSASSGGRSRSQDSVEGAAETSGALELKPLDDAEPLCDAAEHGDIDAVKEILTNAFADPNACSNGKTALYLAAAAGHLEVVCFLLSHGASPNRKSSLGDTPLHVAAANGQTDIVEKLIAEGCLKTDELDLYERTPLHPAAAGGHLEVVTLLLLRGADADRVDGSSESPLHLASARNHYPVVQALIEGGADVNLLNEEGQTPLHIACEEGHVETTQILLAAQADMNLLDSHGVAALYAATCKDHFEIVRLLSVHGANLNIMNSRGQAPLHMAVLQSNLEIIQELVNDGASLDVQDDDGYTPLYLASWNPYKCSRKNNVSTLSYLIEKRANMNICDNGGSAPLLRSFYRKDKTMFESLLRSGADVNIGTCDLLYTAVFLGDVHTCKMLVQSGVDLWREQWLDPNKVTAKGEQKDATKNKESFSMLHGWLKRLRSEPRRLKHVCALTIRRHAVPLLPHRVNRLTLPQCLKDYLLLKNPNSVDDYEIPITDSTDYGEEWINNLTLKDRNSN